MKFRLIEGWQKAYKFHSVQIAVAGSVVTTTWSMLDSATQEAILAKIGLGSIWKPVALAFLGVVVARLKAQQPPKE